MLHRMSVMERITLWQMGKGTQSWFVEKNLSDKSSIKVDGFKKAWSVMYRFSLKPCLVGDFLEACHYHQTNKGKFVCVQELSNLVSPQWCQSLHRICL